MLVEDRAMYIFVSSIGRSGTRFLSELASSLVDFPCHHLEEPYCNGEVYEAINRGEQPEALGSKCDSIRAQADENGGNYFESTPMFVRGFSTAVLKEFSDVRLIHLLRDPLVVAKSYTNRDSFPSHPGRPWRLPLNLDKSLLRVEAPLHPFQENLVDWLENELRLHRMRPQLNSIELLRFEDLVSSTRLAAILQGWGLPVNSNVAETEKLDKNSNKVASELTSEDTELASELIGILKAAEFDRSVFEADCYSEFEFVEQLLAAN